MDTNLSLIAFWGLFCLLVYVYIGYPLVLLSLSAVKRTKPVKGSDATPSVTLIIAAHNEEQVIAHKLQNSLALDYPKDKLEIIVASNGSTDQTDQIVYSFAVERVRLYSMRDAGKTLAQNATVPLAKGEIIIFSDANSTYQRDAIHKLTRNFADRTVGLVQGRIEYEETDSSSTAKGEGLYWRYEDFIKQVESKLGSCIAANGGILAIRRELFEPIAPSLMEDFVLPILTLAKGYQVLFESEAIAREKVSQATGNEFRRKVRIITQDSRSFWILLPKLLKSFRWFSVIQLTSHKLLRWLVPFFLLVIFVTNLILAKNTFYKWILFAQLIFYLLATAGYILRERRTRLLHIPFYFCMVNLAALVGVVRALFGVKMPTWSKTTTTR